MALTVALIVFLAGRDHQGSVFHFALTRPDSDPTGVLTAWAHHRGQPLRDSQDLPQRYERPDKEWSSLHPLA